MSKISNHIKNFFRRCILVLPKGDRIIQRLVILKNKIQFKSVQSLPVENTLKSKELFEKYYHDNFWGNQESVSGAGSTIEYTENIRKEIPNLLKQYNINRFLDAPCGDFNWFQKIDLSNDLKYIGGDIVYDLVSQNQLKYGSQNRKFIYLDITTDILPQVDLWMCRDCLFHFSYDDIFKTLMNFILSDIQYIFTSVHTNCKQNTDITTGGARLLNLELPPFNLCKPIVYVDDWIPGFSVRKMGLWNKSMVSDSLAHYKVSSL